MRVKWNLRWIGNLFVGQQVFYFSSISHNFISQFSFRSEFSLIHFSSYTNFQPHERVKRDFMLEYARERSFFCWFFIVIISVESQLQLSREIESTRIYKFRVINKKTYNKLAWTRGAKEGKEDIFFLTFHSFGGGVVRGTGTSK